MENEIVTPPEPDCVTCGFNPDDCACRFCNRCDRVSPQSCDTCNRCLDCCLCHVCPVRGCGERVRNVCENCERCTDCCECYFCEGCNSQVTSLSCGECGTCNNCDCSCENDNEPNIRFFDPPRKPVFHSAKINEHKRNPSNRFIAVEIEVSEIEENERIDDVVCQWRGGIVKDGSLPDTGFEINTAPASGDVFVKEITEICDALSNSNAKVTSDCGLHVHVDARDLTYYGIRRLATIYSVIEGALFQACSPSRRMSRYCEPCGDRYRHNIGKLTDFKRSEFRGDVVNSVYGTKDSKDRKHDKYDGARYSALNLHSWYYRGTVECRMFNGTVLADKIVPWGILWALIVDAANTLTDKEIESIISNNNDSKLIAGKELLFKIIGDNVSVRDFLIERWSVHATSSALKESV